MFYIFQRRFINYCNCIYPMNLAEKTEIIEEEINNALDHNDYESFGRLSDVLYNVVFEEYNMILENAKSQKNLLESGDYKKPKKTFIRESLKNNKIKLDNYSKLLKRIITAYENVMEARQKMGLI